MIGIVKALLGVIPSLFKSRSALHVEILVLRHQLNVLGRRTSRRAQLTNVDRLFFVWLYRLWPGLLRAVTILRPETIVRWHRQGFRAYWRWRSPRGPGRPKVSEELRDLFREISLLNPLWGAPRVHGELLKLGIDVAQSTVSKYMVRGRGPRGQSWWTFLRNHADGIASIDLFVVPTIAFKLLFAFVVVRHGRRLLVSVGVTRIPQRNGWRDSFWERFRGTPRRLTSFGTVTGHMAKCSSGVFARWVSGIGRYQPGAHGRMPMLSD